MMQLTIIGLGNQAKAWAQNLSDSKFPVRLALRLGSPSLELARKLHLPTIQIGSDEFYQSEAIALLIPDEAHLHFLQEHSQKFQTKPFIIYAHGFSVVKNDLTKKFPELHHALFAPKSIASELRNQFLSKGKLGAVYSTEFLGDSKVNFENWMNQLSVSLGINLGPFKTSFKNETIADLYSEQGLLCSLIPYAAKEMFEHLTRAGIEPELAYFECWHELKLIINAMIDKGPVGFYELISPNALIGSEKGKNRLMTEEFEANLKSLLTDIQTGKFNQEIEQTKVSDLRQKIHDRWISSPLTTTFNKINPEAK